MLQWCGLPALVSAAGLAAGVGPIRYVDDGALPGGDGMTWKSAYRFLQDAIADAAGSGGAIDEIRVAQGTYLPDRNEANPAGTGNRSATFQLVNGTDVIGGFAGIGAPDPDERNVDSFPTILSGAIGSPSVLDNSYHVVTGTGTDETASLDGVTVTAGRADGLSEPDRSGAGMFNDGGRPRLTCCTFQGLYATLTGAGIYTTNQGDLFAGECEFVDNDTERGAGAAVFGSSPVFDQCEFRTSEAVAGVAMYLNDGSDVTVTNCLFAGNIAILYAGAVDVWDSHLVLDGCAFEGNSAHSDAGAVRITNDSSVALSNCSFIGNAAGTEGSAWGGALWVIDSAYSMSGCSFVDNSADEFGAIFHFDLVFATIADCVFLENSATGFGGAMNTGDWGAVQLEGCLFADNSGFHSGGLFVQSGDHVVSHCVFESNEASLNGGGMYIGEGAEPTISDCLFIGNSAGLGGGVSIDPGSGPGPLPTLINCVFVGNASNTLGGGLHARRPSTTPLLINCLFHGNSSQGNGGAIGNHVGARPTLVNCTLFANSAVGQGGGMISDVNAQTVSNCILWANEDQTGNGEPAQITGGSPAISHSCVMGWTGVLGGLANIGDDPQFVDADGLDGVSGTEDDDLRLHPGSPCIDAGKNSAVPADITADLDAHPRFLEVPETSDCQQAPGTCGALPVVDMGPFEALGSGCLAVTSQEVICHADGSTITVTVEGLNGCTGGMTLMTFTANGGAAGEEACFTLLVNDGGFCCSTEICVTVPDCSQPSDPCDLNEDGIVGMADFMALLSAWGSCPDCGECAADFGGDCSVGVLDLLVLLVDWTGHPP